LTNTRGCSRFSFVSWVFHIVPRRLLNPSSRLCTNLGVFSFFFGKPRPPASAFFSLPKPLPLPFFIVPWFFAKCSWHKVFAKDPPGVPISSDGPCHQYLKVAVIKAPPSLFFPNAFGLSCCRRKGAFVEKGPRPSVALRARVSFLPTCLASSFDFQPFGLPFSPQARPLSPPFAPQFRAHIFLL